MVETNPSGDKYASWCTVELERGKRVRVSLKHTGRGKFLILADQENGKFVGKRVDASDIVNCLI
jgi:hypothetical protein